MSDSVMFFDLDLSEIKNPPKAQNKIPTKAGDVMVTNLGTVLNWIITGALSFYGNNRGNGRVSKKTYGRARLGVLRDCLGEVSIGHWEGMMRLADVQSRFYGFLLRYLEGEMTREELASKVSVRCVEDFLQAYMLLNDGDNHRTHDKIKNPDLLYGTEWEKICKNLSSGCLDMIGDKRWTVISSLIYALATVERSADEWYFPLLYGKRSQASACANRVPNGGPIKLTKAQVEDLTEAIQYWHELVLTVKAEAGKVNVGKMVRSAGFFGYVLTAKLSGKNVLPHKIGTLSGRILRNLDKILKICPELCRGNRQEVVIHCGDLTKMLGLKPHSLPPNTRKKKAA